MINRFFRKIGTTNTVLIVVALILSAAIWMFGAFLGWGEWQPFAEMSGKIIAIAGVWVFTLLLILILWILRRRKARKLEDDIVESTEDDSEDSVVDVEVGEVKDKMRKAMTLLRKSKLGGKLGQSHLYQLPWYIIIGPPGAGKTTAIVNSGLKFPLAEEMGKNAVGGVGGTRNCDWWFTNDAVLIDTAGRYTTQDSDQEIDSASWTGFLEMLKRYRKRQPINGALIAISLSDLSMQDEVTQRSHANAIRRRLHELRQKLGVRFPVYVMFTKADLIAGFNEFYDDLGKEDREQVWGFTLKHSKKKTDKPVLEAFNAEFDTLLNQINTRSLERMQSETDHQRRSLIAGFPSQVASLKQVASEFLSEVFQDSRFQDRQMLRGVYFTSGTQEGTPIDRLMMGMARTFGIGRQAIGSGSGTGRSYFLTRMIEGVVFPEAGLVSKDDKVEKRYKLIKWGAIGTAVLVAGVFGTLWTMSFLGNRSLVAEARADLGEYQTLAASIPGSPISDSNIASVVPALNILRDMPGNPAGGKLDADTSLTWGLYQGDAIGTEAVQSYRAALNQHLLPRLLLRLEEQMQRNMNSPELLYEALKIYLMLGLQGPMDSDLVKQWMTIDWSLAFPGPAQASTREDLAGHLDVMLSQPMKKIGLNGPLVDQVQGLLSETPLAQRVYNGIVNAPKAKELQDWRITDAGGPAVKRVLTRSSGTALSDGVEGVYTHEGFYDYFQVELLKVPERVTRESWVLGPRGESEQTPQAIANLTRDVLALYYTDYVSSYDKILGDIDIIPMESLSHAVEVTNILSGPSSPLVNILTSISRETKLTVKPELGLPVETSSEQTDLLRQEALSLFDARQRLYLETLGRANETSGQQREETPGQYVEDRFQWLHDLVEQQEGVPSQLDGIVEQLTQIYQSLNRMAVSNPNAPPETAAVAQLMQSTGRLPGPMQRWAKQIANGSSGITADGTRARLSAQWQGQVLPFCQTALSNRYPFSRRAKADVGLQDFAKLFAPNGLIDGFFQQNLMNYVDTTVKPWRWRKVNDADLGISDQVLQQFQLAAEIRDAFFLAPGLPSITFDLEPFANQTEITQSTIEVDGQKITYAGGPTQVTPMSWPGGAGGKARVDFLPQVAGIKNSMSFTGPWAWFRLLDAAEVRRTNVSDRLRVVFNIGGRIAVYHLRSGSALNPFTLPALRGFKCPKSL